MKTRGLILLRTLALCAMLFAAVLPVQAETAQHSTSGVYTFEGAVVPGVWSELVRNDAGATMNVHTSGLPQHAFTVWWIVFNFPNNCSHGVPGISQCGQLDTAFFGGDPAVQSSVLYATGHVIGAAGEGNFGADLALGATDGALFGPGLLQPRTAEVWLVIRSHGPVIPSLVNEQIGALAVVVSMLRPVPEHQGRMFARSRSSRYIGSSQSDIGPARRLVVADILTLSQRIGFFVFVSERTAAAPSCRCVSTRAAMANCCYPVFRLHSPYQL